MNASLTRGARLAAASTILALASLVLPAAASARQSVDPATLNPAPPDFFNAQCYEGAGGTLCTLHFADDPIVDEPSGILCGTTELLVSQTRSVVGKRTYDADGNLVQRHFREELGGVLSNPVTGISVPWLQHDTVIHDLSIPGDLDSGTVRVTGLQSRFFLPAGGTVLIDAGTTIHTGTGDLVRESGPHPLVDYFELGVADALRPLCDAMS